MGKDMFSTFETPSMIQMLEVNSMLLIRKPLKRLSTKPLHGWIPTTKFLKKMSMMLNKKKLKLLSTQSSLRCINKLAVLEACQEECLEVCQEVSILLNLLELKEVLLEVLSLKLKKLTKLLYNTPYHASGTLVRLPPM